MGKTRNKKRQRPQLGRLGRDAYRKTAVNIDRSLVAELDRLGKLHGSISNVINAALYAFSELDDAGRFEHFRSYHETHAPDGNGDLAAQDPGRRTALGR